MRKTLYFFFFLVASISVSAQNQKALDSLNQVYENTLHDSTRVNVMYEIAYIYALAKSDTTISISNKALQISEKIKFDRGKARTCTLLGKFYARSGKGEEALKYYSQALELYQKNKDDNNISRLLSYIGVIYQFRGKYTEAMAYYEKSMKIDEKNAYDKKRIGVNVRNLAGIYLSQGNYPKSLEYYYKSLS